MERDHCPIHGGVTSECPDDKRDWFPQRDVCFPAAQLAAANRRYDLLHQDKPYHNGYFEAWTEEPTRETPFHYRDGVTIWLSPVELNPDDDFLVPPEELEGEGQEGDDR